HPPALPPLKGVAECVPGSVRREEADPAPACRWWGNILTGEEAAGVGRVCRKCVRLFIGAASRTRKATGKRTKEASSVLLVSVGSPGRRLWMGKVVPRIDDGGS